MLTKFGRWNMVMYEIFFFGKVLQKNNETCTIKPIYNDVTIKRYFLLDKNLWAVDHRSSWLKGTVNIIKHVYIHKEKSIFILIDHPSGMRELIYCQFLSICSLCHPSYIYIYIYIYEFACVSECEAVYFFLIDSHIHVISFKLVCIRMYVGIFFKYLSLLSFFLSFFLSLYI